MPGPDRGLPPPPLTSSSGSSLHYWPQPALWGLLPFLCLEPVLRALRPCLVQLCPRNCEIYPFCHPQPPYSAGLHCCAEPGLCHLFRDKSRALPDSVTLPLLRFPCPCYCVPAPVVVPLPLLLVPLPLPLCPCASSQWLGTNSDESKRQPEVAAVMQWTRSHHFVLSASLHGVSHRDALGVPVPLWGGTS